ADPPPLRRGMPGLDGAKAAPERGTRGRYHRTAAWPGLAGTRQPPARRPGDPGGGAGPGRDVRLDPRLTAFVLTPDERGEAAARAEGGAVATGLRSGKRGTSAGATREGAASPSAPGSAKQYAVLHAKSDRQRRRSHDRGRGGRRTWCGD